MTDFHALLDNAVIFTIGYVIGDLKFRVRQLEKWRDSFKTQGKKEEHVHSS